MKLSGRGLAPARTKFECEGGVTPHPRINGSIATIGDCGPWECRWPYGGSSSTMALCGRAKIFGSPYCLIHYQLARAGRKGGSDAQDS